MTSLMAKLEAYSNFELFSSKKELISFLEKLVFKSSWIIEEH